MRTLAQVVAPLALAATILPPVLYLLRLMPEAPMKWTMLVAALAWFATAPFWMKGGR